MSPLVGFEALKGTEALVAGFADNATKDDVEEWTDKGLEIMEGFEEEYFKIERNAEQEGWMKASPRVSVRVPVPFRWTKMLIICSVSG